MVSPMPTYKASIPGPPASSLHREGRVASAIESSRPAIRAGGGAGQRGGANNQNYHINDGLSFFLD
jgi:hypothetical protein